MAKKPALNNSTLLVGFDAGYGFVKCVTDKAVKVFPSVAGHARDLKFQKDEITVRYPGMQITDGEGKWFIGELALSQIPVGELLRLRGRTANESEIGNAFRLRMLKVALGLLMPGLKGGDVIHISMVTGLPVDHMADARDLKEVFIGKHVVKTDNTEFVANITECRVMPQPLGSIYSRTITETGEINRAHKARRTAVVDVGTYTIDTAVDDEGEFINSLSASVEAGVYTAQRYIADVLERKYRQKMSPAVVEEVLRTGRFRASGQWATFHDEVNEALGSLRSATLNLMGDYFKSGTELDEIYLSGGGAHLVHGDVLSAYPQARFLEEPQTANARGYLNYLKFKTLNP